LGNRINKKESALVKPLAASSGVVVALERKVRRKQSFLQNRQNPLRMKYWEIGADDLSKAGWSWGYVSAVDSCGRTIFVADAHHGDNR
jgi:hypothetical protein